MLELLELFVMVSPLVWDSFVVHVCSSNPKKKNYELEWMRNVDLSSHVNYELRALVLNSYIAIF